jgi:nuclear transport factor 2 (NTF2) superfamily protein
MAKKKNRILAEVTLANGRKSIVDFETEPWNYDSDMEKLKEIWGEQNVKEIKE